MAPLLLIAASYLLGSISFANIIGSFAGVDLNSKGTRNPGATNVFLVVGRLWGVLAALFDLSKGIIPVIIARQLAYQHFYLVILTAFAVIAGHNWPVFYGFSGGRGLATTLGTIIPIAFFPGLLAFTAGVVLTWFLTASYKLRVRIPYITYPLFTALLVIYYQNIFLWLYGLGITLISFFRAWQLRDAK